MIPAAVVLMVAISLGSWFYYQSLRAHRMRDEALQRIRNLILPLDSQLRKLLIEQTKSRPRRSNDNGLVESKNGAVIRKQIGYGHIAAEHAGINCGAIIDHRTPRERRFVAVQK